MVRVAIKTNFVGSRLAECILVGIDKRTARERELAIFDENPRAVGILNAMRDKNKRYVPGWRGVDTCGHGLSRSSLSVKPPTSKAGK